MARMIQWLGVAVLGFAMSGCVALDKYNALKLDNESLKEQLGKAQNDANAAAASAKAYKDQYDDLLKNAGNRDALVNNLSQENATLKAKVDELTRLYDEAMKRPSTGSGPLPVELSNALEEFARQNPDLVEFDKAHGIVKFKSDVTFALGSAELTPKAKEAIDRFSQILNSPAASSFELMVAGHTDNARVVNPQTIQQGHKDNWYLSAHRAISVSEELMSRSVSGQRLGVVGYADQRPAKSNATDSGRAANRRVEVLILPTTGNFTAAPGHSAAPKATKSGPNKDSVVAPTPERRPSLNK